MNRKCNFRVRRHRVSDDTAVVNSRNRQNGSYQEKDAFQKVVVIMYTLHLTLPSLGGWQYHQHHHQQQRPYDVPCHQELPRGGPPPPRIYTLSR